jgi:hypothetical protein
MGEVQGTLFPLRFNGSLRIRETSERMTGDGGAILLREIGERLGLWKLLERSLEDSRDRARVKHPFIELIRTAVLPAAQGWTKQRDVTPLRHDSAFRMAVSNRRGQSPLLTPESSKVPDGLASQATMSRLMDTLSSSENRQALRTVISQWSAMRQGMHPASPSDEITLDLDSLPLEVHGHQEASAYNGHYRCSCFHPLILSMEGGEFLDAMLRSGNVYTSTGALPFLEPHLAWFGERIHRGWLRIDAGFPSEDFLSGVEAHEKWRYVARLKSNPVLEAMALPYVNEMLGTKGPDWQPKTHSVELGRYQAKSGKAPWTCARRVVLILEESIDSSMPKWFFLVTNALVKEASGLALLNRYRRRGTAEKDYGEWKNTLQVALSSTNRMKRGYLGRQPKTRSDPVDSFAVNEALLLLGLLTANLLHTARTLMAAATGQLWSRLTFRNRALKVPGRFTRNARYVQVHIHEAYAAIWQSIHQQLDRLALGLSPPPARTLPSRP